MNTDKPTRGLASKGIEFYPNYTGESSRSINYLLQIGDITKGEREELDATCMDDDIECSILGIRKKSDDYEVKFLYNAKEKNSDYQVISALEDAAESVPILVKMPDGSQYANSGVPSLTINSVGINSRVEATAKYKLDGDWQKTFPQA